MKPDQYHVFYYRGAANAFGGSLWQPLVREVSTRASVSLSTAGGHQQAVHEDFQVDGLISVKRASVRVSGSEHLYPVGTFAEQQRPIKSWRTVSSATLEGLNILEVLTADRIVAQVASDHPDDHGPAKVTLLGSRFENLRVHGEAISTVPDSRIFGGHSGGDAVPGHKPRGPLTHDELIQLAVEQQDERRKLTPTHSSHERLLCLDPAQDLERKGIALCSLVQAVSTRAPVESMGHMLHIPDFGNVFLGEMMISRFSTQLTMLRVEMGSMGGGSLSGGSVFSNGALMP